MNEIALWKKLVWQIIEDYFLCANPDERKASEKLLYSDSALWREHFEWICENAGYYNADYVRSRVNTVKERNLYHGFKIHLGRNIMGEWDSSKDYKRPRKQLKQHRDRSHA